MTAKKPTRKAASEPQPEPSLAEKARKQEVRNILKRLQSGDRITDRERQLIDDYERQENGGDKPADRMEADTFEIAQILGIAKPTVYSFIKRGVFRKEGGTFNIPETVQAYLRFKTVGVSDDEIMAREQVKAETEVEKLNLTRYQAQYQKKKVEVLEGQYIPRAEVETALAPVFADFTDFLRGNFEREFPAWAVGKTAPDIKAECQQRIDNAITRVRNGSSKALDAAEERATGQVSADDQTEQAEILRPGRKKEPNSRRVERAKRHATQGRPAAGRKPKKT